MLILIENAEPLPEQWLDHALTGQWSKHRECHIGGDFLLIYKLEKSSADEQIIFVRAGTHAELFEWNGVVGFRYCSPNLRATGYVAHLIAFSCT